MLFETCNFNCAYCNFTTSGSVADIADLTPYRDQTYIDRIIRFFNQHSTESEKWVLHLSGGEPTIMPNFGYFCEQAFSFGHKIALNTNLSFPLHKEAFQKICPPDKIEFIHASLHQEGLDDLDKYLNRCRILRDAGYALFVRIVAHPNFIDLLPELDQKFKAIDVSLSVHPLQSPNYPLAYTKEQIDKIIPFMKTHHDVIRLFGGLDAQDRKCRAGSGLLCISLGLRGGGRVYPCVNTASGEHEMGNIFSREVSLMGNETSCLRSDNKCTCAMHFVHGNIPSLDDPDEFEQLIRGYKQGVGDSWRDWFEERNIRTKDGSGEVKGLPKQGTPIGEIRTKLPRPPKTRFVPQTGGEQIDLPLFDNWFFPQEVTKDVQIERDQIRFTSAPVKYEYLAYSPPLFLEAGFYRFEFDLRLSRGGLQVGVMNEAEGTWLSSENHYLSGKKFLEFEVISSDSNVLIMLGSANHHGDQISEVIFLRPHLIRLHSSGLVN